MILAWASPFKYSLLMLYKIYLGAETTQIIPVTYNLLMLYKFVHRCGNDPN